MLGFIDIIELLVWLAERAIEEYEKMTRLNKQKNRLLSYYQEKFCTLGEEWVVTPYGIGKRYE